jgi:hypothetical protein
MAILVKKLDTRPCAASPTLGNLSSTEIVFCQFGSRLGTKLKRGATTDKPSRGLKGRPAHRPTHATPCRPPSHLAEPMLRARSCTRGPCCSRRVGAVRGAAAPSYDLQCSDAVAFPNASRAPHRAAGRRGNPQAIHWPSTGFSTGCPPGRSSILERALRRPIIWPRHAD